jgi:hypothetical protein
VTDVVPNAEVILDNVAGPGVVEVGAEAVASGSRYKEETRAASSEKRILAEI